jgi:tRNA modification GTPase
VTPIPGTTRDAVEDWVELGGVLLTLADTAGLRSPGDEIEAEGIRRTRQLIRESQLLLAVVEVSSPPTPDEVRFVADLAGDAPVIPVLNKTDIGGDIAGWTKALAALEGRCGRRSGEGAAGVDGAALGEGAGCIERPHPILGCACVSARRGDGVADLKERIVEVLCGSAGSLEAYSDEVLLTNVRHADALQRADQGLDRVQRGLGGGLSDELLAFEVGQALQALGEITGESAHEDVLEAIFSRFCIGK